MLKQIPAILPPELFMYMMEMGHSDRLLLADANYPAKTHAKRFVRAEGIEIPQLLEAVMAFYPLDHFVPEPVTLMNPLKTEPAPEIWVKYRQILTASGEGAQFRYRERLDFYEESKAAYVIVQTATTARYANIMLQKGVL